MANNVTFQQRGALAFFQKYPIVVLVDSTNMKRIGFKSSGDQLLSVKAEARIQYGAVTYQNTWQGVPIVPDDAGEDVHAFTVSSRDPDRFKIPVYFLPYAVDENHRITLKNKAGEFTDEFQHRGHADYHDTRDVALFISDNLNGCSIYVEGTRQTPTVYHLNARSHKGSTDKPTDRESRRVWKKKWRHMDERFRTEGRKVWTVQSGANLQQAKHIRDDDYMIRRKTRLQRKETNFLADAPAPHELRAPNTGKTVDSVIVETRGMPFGVCDAHGDWTFYAQSFYVVTYMSGGLPVGVKCVVRWVKEFWPGGTIGAAV